jgi:glycosyltransferase involved in cell wall biosynthesis
MKIRDLKPATPLRHDASAPAGVEVDGDADDRSIAIVIPAHNEAAGIGAVLEDLLAHKPPGVTEVIVIDDGSTDGTGDIAHRAGARVIRHKTNRGYGAGLKTGIRAATARYVLTMDADGQHRVEDVARLCELVAGGDVAESVIGHRKALLHSKLWRMPGKWFLRRLAQFLVARDIPDLNSGLRVIRRDIALKYISLCPQGFSFSTTITMALLARGYGVDFVPIEVKPRVGKSTVSVRTGLQTILLVLRLATLFNPLRIFLPASLLCFVAGIGWGVRYVLAGQGVTVASMLAILTGVLLFGLGLICDQVAQLRLARYE